MGMPRISKCGRFDSLNSEGYAVVLLVLKSSHAFCNAHMKAEGRAYILVLMSVHEARMISYLQDPSSRYHA